MDKIRLGNDIEMRWSIFTRDGDNRVPYDLEGRALTLSVVNRKGESEIEFFAEGNIVTGVFRGRDQKILGKHGVILRENNGEDGMRTVDACDAFELVACSCEEALGSPGTIQLFHLTFDTTVGAITGTIDPILNYEAEQAEAERKANEIVRKADEEQRIKNENQRNADETLRNIAEEERESAEQERIVNEDLRKADEAERKTNEESRLQNESERVSSEEERLYAESIRVANENTRIASEAKRKEAETARIEAEDKRIVSEKSRLSAESSRIANEDSRRANEDSRRANEDSRLSAESIRVSSELERATAEEERKIAEEKRQAKFASMVVQSTGDATDKVMSQKAVTDALEGKQEKLVPGDNITIVGNVISSTGGGPGGSVDLSAYAKKADVEVALEGKQDTISDLESIREGASLGKTALQEHQDISGLATKEEVATKQDKISDLDTIREGATKGATALQSYTETDPIYTADKPSLALKSELDGKQDIISDLDVIRQGAVKGSTALQSESDPVYLADKPSLALKTEIPDISGKADKATTLAGYGIGDAYTKNEVEMRIASKQDTLTAGENITIVGNVISSTGGGNTDLSAYAKKADVEVALEGKQDTISDLESIREGAALGKTALQEHQDISGLATKEEVATKQDKISDLATIRSGAAKGATALQSYTETDPVYMADKPSLALKTEIPDISGKADKSELSSVATSGSYDDLTNKPTIPSKTSELTNDSGYLNSIPEEYVTETELDSKGYLTEHQDISGKADKATTLSGYGITDAYTKNEVNAKLSTKVDSVAGKGLSTEDYTSEEKTKLAGLSNYDDTAIKADLAKKANDVDLATVAKSGLYSDLTGTPTIPTKTSELTNDSGYLTSVPEEYVTETELEAKGYLTKHQDISGKEDKYTSATSSSGTVELSDTKMYILGEQSSVTITLPSGAESNGREYLCQFTASAAGCTLSVPDTISWLGGETPTINAGKTYQLSIVNNLAVIGEF